jgi:hypothetical protein
MTTEAHNTNPRGRVLYGEGPCPHCQKRTRHVLEACGQGRRICVVCVECNRHRRVLDTSPEDARHNAEAQTVTV